jgi:hypothetical protein
VPHDPYGDAADPRAAQDAAWREIVENYGDRPLLDDEPDEQPPAEPVAEHPAAVAEPPPAPAPAPVAPPEEHFVPPPPPPVPWAEPRRLLAWLGLFGVPVLVLVGIVTQVSVPSWLGLLLMVWFVGGFVFLVASMRPGPRDEDDDGAVV